MFETVDLAPPDAILGLTEAFKKDPNPHKISLGAGIYRDAAGQTPVLAAVHEAQRRVLAAETSKEYVPMEGDRAFGACVRSLLFGADHPIIAAGRAATCHTPGGTGALRLAGDYLKVNHPGATLWLSAQTWANHPAVFAAAGVPISRYRYLDGAAAGELAFDAMLDDLRRVADGDVVLLHGCCHNPTGADPTADQWARIADQLAERKVLALVDFAYQGFGDGLEQDAAGLRRLCDSLSELLVCSSYSKNFGVYNERVGALTLVAGSAAAAQAVLSNVKLCIRRNYSSPPAHGAAIVRTVLEDTDLRQQWEGELTRMRDRINGMRHLFVRTLEAMGCARDFSFITRQRGMFSFSGLSREQVQILREQSSIYVVADGRINFAGMTEQNMQRLCAAMIQVL